MGVPGSSDWLAAIFKRLYRALLIFYPRQYRREYGTKMVQVFGDQCREEQRKRGLVGLVELGFRTVADLVVTAFQERSTSTSEKIRRQLYREPKNTRWSKFGLVYACVFIVFCLAAYLAGTSSAAILPALAAGIMGASFELADLVYARRRGLAALLRLVSMLALASGAIFQMANLFVQGKLVAYVLFLATIAPFVATYLIISRDSRIGRRVERAIAWVGGVDPPRR
jgi:hypothetical protein